MSGTKVPTIADTGLGPIEYIQRGNTESKSTEVILTIHGAMGGYDQSDI